MKPTLTCLIAASLFSTGPCFGDPQAQLDPQMEAMAGSSLDAKAAGDLEDTVAGNPDDLSSRTKLLGYYFGRNGRTAEAKQKQLNHVLWIIKNHPEAPVLGLPYCRIDNILNPDGYHQAKTLLKEQTQAHPENTRIQGNAAAFFLLSDPILAEKFLVKACTLAPTDPQWPDQLGQLYMLQSMNSKDDSAAKALIEFEKAQTADPDEMSRFYRLNSLAKAAIQAGEIEKAALYANESLKAAEKDPKDWNAGNAIHQGNNVLGLIALKNGDLKQASEYLLKAGKTTGSPQLNSFGPNMTLAKRLLENGQREPVLQYFDLCRKFWEMGGARLDQWTKEVKADLTPDFGGNLAY